MCLVKNILLEKVSQKTNYVMCLVKNILLEKVSQKTNYVMCLVKNQKQIYVMCLVKNQKQIYVMLPCKKPTKKGKHQRCFKEEENFFFLYKIEIYFYNNTNISY